MFIGKRKIIPVRCWWWCTSICWAIYFRRYQFRRLYEKLRTEIERVEISCWESIMHRQSNWNFAWVQCRYPLFNQFDDYKISDRGFNEKKISFRPAQFRGKDLVSFTMHNWQKQTLNDMKVRDKGLQVTGLYTLTVPRIKIFSSSWWFDSGTRWEVRRMWNFKMQNCVSDQSLSWKLWFKERI